MQNYELLGVLRIKNKLTQIEISKILNVSLNTYKDFEAGRRTMNLEQLNTLSDYYDVSLNTLLGLSNSLECFNINKNINYKMLAFYLKYTRIKFRYTQKELAKKFYISTNAISRYENMAQKVSLDYLYWMGKEFKISIDYICDKTNKKEIL